MEEAYWRLLEEYPGLAVQIQEMRDQENGFLAMLSLIQRIEENELKIESFLHFSPSLLGWYGKKEPRWSLEAAQSWVNEHRELFQELESVCRMPGGWISRDHLSLLQSHEPGILLDLMMILGIRARVEIESGRHDSTRESIRMIQVLEARQRELEMTGMFAMLSRVTIGIVHEGSLKHLSTLEGPEAMAWREVLDQRAASPAELAEVLRRNWNYLARYELLPGIHGEKGMILDLDYSEVVDGARLVAVYTEWMAELAGRMEHASFPDLIEVSWSSFDAIRERLPQRDREIFEDLAMISMEHVDEWRIRQLYMAEMDARAALMAGMEAPIERMTGKRFEDSGEEDGMFPLSGDLVDRLESQRMELIQKIEEERRQGDSD